jgi:5-dehydro-2-deoxygluconokinase
MFAQLQKNSFLIMGRAGLDLYADPPGSEIEHAKEFSAALGGSAANIAVALSKQGGKAALATSVSKDAVGRFTLNALKSYNIDVQYISTVGGEARNSLAVVETRNVNCQSVIYRNGAADFEMNAEDAARIAYSDYAALVVTGTCLAAEPSRSATLKAMHLAKAAGLMLIIDVDYRPYSWPSRDEARRVCCEAVSLCDIVVANDEEFAVLADDGLAYAERLSHTTAKLVVYKMGEKGAISFSAGKKIETPIYRVEALKPTGAGDAFMGGMLSGLVQGSDIETSIKRGAATAAIVVTRVGCAPAMPTADDVATFMKMVRADVV